MDSLRGVISDIRVFMNTGISRLPIIMAGTFLIVGLFSANYAMILFLVGFLIGAPATAFCINYVIGDKFNVSSSDACKLFVPFSTPENDFTKTEKVAISTSTAMTAFFLGYIGNNSITMALRNPEEGADESKVSHRKVSSFITFSCIILFTLYVGWRKYSATCEEWYMLLFGGLLFGAMGYYWYNVLTRIDNGDGRLADITGIANSLLKQSSFDVNTPVACVIPPQ
jgi:hypothetical protein